MDWSRSFLRTLTPTLRSIISSLCAKAPSRSWVGARSIVPKPRSRRLKSVWKMSAASRLPLDERELWINLSAIASYCSSTARLLIPRRSPVRSSMALPQTSSTILISIPPPGTSSSAASTMLRSFIGDRSVRSSERKRPPAPCSALWFQPRRSPVRRSFSTWVPTFFCRRWENAHPENQTPGLSHFGKPEPRGSWPAMHHPRPLAFLRTEGALAKISSTISNNSAGCSGVMV